MEEEQGSPFRWRSLTARGLFTSNNSARLGWDISPAASGQHESTRIWHRSSREKFQPVEPSHDEMCERFFTLPIFRCVLAQTAVTRALQHEVGFIDGAEYGLWAFPVEADKADIGVGNHAPHVVEFAHFQNRTGWRLLSQSAPFPARRATQRWNHGNSAARFPPHRACPLHPLQGSWHYSSMLDPTVCFRSTSGNRKGIHFMTHSPVT